MAKLARVCLMLAVVLVTPTCSSGGGGGGAGGCGAWSEWRTIDRTCRPALFCFGSSLRRMCDNQERTRECNNGIQRLTRSANCNCGCPN
jgi:hypothetical protein